MWWHPRTSFVNVYDKRMHAHWLQYLVVNQVCHQALQHLGCTLADMIEVRTDVDVVEWFTPVL